MNLQLFKYTPEPWFPSWLAECNSHFKYRYLGLATGNWTIVNVFSWKHATNPGIWEIIDECLYEANETFPLEDIEEFYHFIKLADLSTLRQTHPEYFL